MQIFVKSGSSLLSICFLQNGSVALLDKRSPVERALRTIRQGAHYDCVAVTVVPFNK